MDQALNKDDKKSEKPSGPMRLGARQTAAARRT